MIAASAGPALAASLAAAGRRGHRQDRNRRRHRDPGPGRRGDRCQQRRLARGIERHQRQREAVHVQRGHVGPGAEQQPDPRREIRAQHRSRHHAHLERRHRAEVVEDQRVVGTAGRQRRRQTRGHRGHQRRDTGERNLLDPRLAVDAEAELGLVVPHPRLGLLPGDGAGRERQPERADVSRGLTGGGGDLGERGALLGEMAGDLVHEERTGDAPRLRQVGKGDVVGDDDHLDREPFGPGALGGEAEVQPVAGVVLHDQKTARRSGRGTDRGEHGRDRGRGEDLARDGSGQHALADEARVRRLVAGATARHDRDLRRIAVLAQHDLDLGIAVEADEAAAGSRDQPVQRLGHDALAGVDEVLAHGILKRDGRHLRRTRAGGRG